MTAPEVQQAVQWHRDEKTRLTRIAAPWEEMPRISSSPSLTSARAEWWERLAAMSAVSEAVHKLDRIMTLVYAAIPQWRRSKLTFGQALRHYWPR